jgi:hypothetical protein
VHAVVGVPRRRKRSCKWREISAEIPEFWVANMTPSEIKAAREKYNYVPARLIRAGVSVAADLSWNSLKLIGCTKRMGCKASRTAIAVFII